MKTKQCINCILITSFSFLLLFYLSGCASTKQNMLDSGMKQLTTKELKALFSEKREAKVYNTKKNRWYAYTYLPDESIIIAGKTKNRLRVYTIENDRFCLKRKATSSKSICSSWLKIDADTYYTYEKDGSLLEKQTFQ